MDLLEWRRLAAEYEAVEVRVDGARPRELENILIELQTVKQCCPQLEFILTLRSAEEGGLFSGTQGEYLAFVEWASRVSPRVIGFLDLELRRLRRDYTLLDRLPGRVILSRHFLGPNRLSELEELVEDLRSQKHAGKVILKVALNAGTREEEYREAERLLRGSQLQYILIQLGSEAGRLTRVLNQRLSPVYDARIGAPTGPGQLTRAEILRHRQELGVARERRNFVYLIGSCIQRSLSPEIQNFCYERMGLSGSYLFQRHEVGSLDSLRDLFGSEEFRGAAVTIPFKQEVVPFLDELEGVAR